MNKYINLPSLNEIEPQLDVWLYESQRLYEQAVKKYIQFKEYHIECQIKYEKEFADSIQKHKGSGEKVTIVKEIAQAECSKSYENMLKAEAQKRKWTMWTEAIQNRIQMIKYLMKRKYGDMHA